MADTTVTIALVGIVGGVITSLFALLRQNTKALNALVAETRDGNEKAEVRNGHLGEQSVKVASLVNNGNKLTAKIIKKMDDAAVKTEQVRVDLAKKPIDQHVDHQVVDKQTINGGK
jgi:uncharacterized protein YxeA